MTGIDLTDEHLSTLLDVDLTEWRNELGAIGAYYATFGSRLPAALDDQLRQLADRLGAKR